MSDREKLIELIVRIPVPCMLVAGVRGGKSLLSASVLADHLLANGVTFAKDTDAPSKWISVKDRLPEDMGDVLVCAFWHERWQTMIAWCRKADEQWFAYTSHGERMLGHVTHWMPLPEPPGEG